MEEEGEKEEDDEDDEEERPQDNHLLSPARRGQDKYPILDHTFKRTPSQEETEDKTCTAFIERSIAAYDNQHLIHLAGR